MHGGTPQQGGDYGGDLGILRLSGGVNTECCTPEYGLWQRELRQTRVHGPHVAAHWRQAPLQMPQPVPLQDAAVRVVARHVARDS